jgi:hypothetical protein
VRVQGFLCKLIGTTQASCIFFSSFSILLIAIDRHETFHLLQLTISSSHARFQNILLEN